MTFTVIPALDLWGGRLAEFTPDGPRPVSSFDGDPVAAADAFASAGATWLHVVDMDLAYRGEAANVDLVARLAGHLPGVRIQAAGGIRTEAEAERYLESGAGRVVMGSAALADGSEVLAAIGRWASAVLVGIEVRGGEIRSRGRDPVRLGLMETLGWLVPTGVAGLLVTSLGRVGTGVGPDTTTVRRVVRAGRPVLAAGGVATMEHLRDLREAGAVGAVVGRGALEGRIDLREALGQAPNRPGAR